MTEEKNAAYALLRREIVASFGILGCLGGMIGTVLYIKYGPSEAKEEAAHPFYQKDATLIRVENNNAENNKYNQPIGCFDLDGNPETIEAKANFYLGSNLSNRQPIYDAVFKDNINRTRKISEWNGMGFSIKRPKDQHTR